MLWSVKRPRFRTAVSLAGLVLLAACATVPITGRSQLRLVSDDVMAQQAGQFYVKFMSEVRQKNALASPSESP